MKNIIIPIREYGPAPGNLVGFLIMKLIPLTQGQFAQVDDWNYDWLMQWEWQLLISRDKYYAIRVSNREKGVARRSFLMHREIMKAKKGEQLDHKDRNGLNCLEENLRFCNQSQNNMNKRGWGKGKYKGVNIKEGKYFTANIQVLGKNTYLGSFKTPENAAEAYNEAAIKHFGEFACLNIID